MKSQLSASRNWRTVFDVAQKEKKLEKLEKETQKPDFWNDKENAVKTTRELAELKEETLGLRKLKEDFETIKELQDKTLLEEFERKLKQKEFQVFLSGKYDEGDAVLSIMAGAGGQDSQDWATMLLRMYQRYCERRGFKNKILEQSFGEAGGPEGRIGTKSVALEIKGSYAYGFLKKETGVHRLVRISPFSSQSLRHTSFALVEITPDIETKKPEVEINSQDLKIDFYRASGPGGQYVNKRETAVRITHLPTGLVVSCQSERTQGDNRGTAMKMLLAKLYRLQQETRQKEMKEARGEKISASWSNQIRN
ncbi:MAG: PCRF domain-containing protein, partial [Candidatus Wildermuthbacteria bacterium]|nr:PCRF domain-containing protein [Candidatus Wildermuthbacteria bacterium]